MKKNSQLNKAQINGIVVILMVIGLVIGLFFFEELNKSFNSTNNNSQNNSQNYDKTLVAYFPGITENNEKNISKIANYIADYLKIETFEIKPLVPYLENYTDLEKVISDEKSRNLRPDFEKKLNNLNDYDTIFIGFPIWNDDFPMIIYTFLESYDFQDKTIILFSIYNGSKNLNLTNSLKDKLINGKVISNELIIDDTLAKTTKGEELTIKWLNELNFNQ